MASRDFCQDDQMRCQAAQAGRGTFCSQLGLAALPLPNLGGGPCPDLGIASHLLNLLIYPTVLLNAASCHWCHLHSMHPLAPWSAVPLPWHAWGSQRISKSQQAKRFESRDASLLVFDSAFLQRQLYHSRHVSARWRPKIRYHEKVHKLAYPGLE